MSKIRASKSRENLVGALALASTLAFVVTGCSANVSGGDGDTTATTGDSNTVEVVALAPIAERPLPAMESEEPVKIAILGFSNNPYWVAVQSGSDTANDVLAGFNGTVDWITAGENIDVQTVNDAVNSAAIQGYDGIGFFIAGEGNCDTVAKLTAEGISLGAYNTLFDCLIDAGAVINYAQEQTDAGKLAAEQLIEATGNATGTVGIITSKFTAPGAEMRRLGFIEGLQGSNLTVIGEGVEANDSASETFTLAQNYISANADLVGLYATAGGPFGAAEAVAAAGKQDSIKVIGFDLSEENLAAIQDGSMFGAIGQDAFGQGYNVAIELFNAIVTGEKRLGQDVLVPADTPFVTKKNFKDHDAKSLPLGTPGTS
jgi:ribose transport system substrate-binding protein